MKLIIKDNAKVQPLFPTESEPSFIEDKAQCYGPNKLPQWEQLVSNNNV